MCENMSRALRAESEWSRPRTCAVIKPKAKLTQGSPGGSQRAFKKNTAGPVDLDMEFKEKRMVQMLAHARKEESALPQRHSSNQTHEQKPQPQAQEEPVVKPDSTQLPSPADSQPTQWHSHPLPRNNRIDVPEKLASHFFIRYVF